MKHLQKWGLPLLTGVVVLATVLLPRQISALRDGQTLDAIHTEPMAQEDLTLQEGTLPEKLGLLGRAIRYPGLDVYSATQPLEEVDEETWSKAEAVFLCAVEKLAAWGVLPEMFDRTALTFQGGSRVVYVQADGGLSAGMLYLQGETDNRDDLRMALYVASGLPVLFSCSVRPARGRLRNAHV